MDWGELLEIYAFVFGCLGVFAALVWGIVAILANLGR